MISFVIALCLLIAGYFTYGRFVSKIFGADPNRKTPVHTMADGVDYVPLPTWKIFLIQCIIRMSRKRWMIDTLHQRMFCQIRNHFFSIFCMALQAKRQCLHSLQQQERIKRRDASSHIPKQDCPDFS